MQHFRFVIFSRSIVPNLLFLMKRRNAIIRKLFALTFGSYHCVMVRCHRANSTIVRDIYGNLTSHSSSDQWRVSNFIFQGEISILRDFSGKYLLYNID